MTTLSVKSVILGDPASPRHQINPFELKTLLDQIQNLASLNSNLYFEDTLEDLGAVATPPEGSIGFVLDDGANTGTYRYESEAWVLTASLPPSFADGGAAEASGFAILRQSYLPGDTPQNFTQTLTGPTAATLDPIGSIEETAQDGAFFRLTGAKTIAGRERVLISSDKRYEVQWQVRRATNPTDPAGDTVRFGIVWLNGLKQLLQDQTVQDVVLTSAMGVYSLARFVVPESGSASELQPPAGAVYMVPYIKTFGADGVTDVLRLGWENAAYAADVSDLAYLVDLEDASDSATAQYVTFAPGTEGAQKLKTDDGLVYTPSTGTLELQELEAVQRVNTDEVNADTSVNTAEVNATTRVNTPEVNATTRVVTNELDAQSIVLPPEFQFEQVNIPEFPVARTFYVTADGSDSASGESTSHPLATVKAALLKMASLAPLPCITIVHPGEYLVPPDTEVPANCALYGYDLRVTKLILANAAGTAAAVGAEKQNNMLLMTSGMKVRGFTFAGMQHEAFTLEGGPPNKGYAFAFKPGEAITRSPYIADCSQLHTFTQNEMTLPIDKAAGNPLMPIGAGNILADGSVLDYDSPLRSVVVDSFTAINPNGVAYTVKRNAFVQLVSVFTNWSRVGLWAHEGGQVTVANSNNTFGDYALASTGYRNAIQIEGVADPSVLGTYTSSASIIVSQTEAIVANLMNVRYPTITGWGSLDSDQLALTERDTRTLLRFLVNDLNSGQDRGSQYFTKGLFNWNAEYAFSGAIVQLFLDAWEQVRLELLSRLSDVDAEAMVTALIAMISDVVENPADYRVGFPSVIEATGQQFSNAGSGVNYNSLPFSQRGTGENPDPSTATYKSGGGRIYATFSTEVGDTYLGEDLRVDFERSTIEGQAFSRGVQNITLPLILAIGA